MRFIYYLFIFNSFHYFIFLLFFLCISMFCHHPSSVLALRFSDDQFIRLLPERGNIRAPAVTASKENFCPNFQSFNRKGIIFLLFHASQSSITSFKALNLLISHQWHEHMPHRRFFLVNMKFS